jgi:hypothetical protein
MPITVGEVRNLVPHPTRVNPIGGLVAIRDIHYHGGKTLVEVTGLVAVDPTKRQPGDDEVIDLTWMVEPDRIA